MKHFTIIIIASIFFCIQNDQVLGLTGGQPAKEGEFPFMVSIKRSGYSLHCGGTILSERWVLSSSMCYPIAWWGNVSYGSTQLYENTTNQIKIDDVLYNPWAYDRPPYPHDLILIHLSKPIPFGDKVQPVKLPELDEPWPGNQKAIMLGWSLEVGENRTPIMRTDLQKAEIQLYNNTYCSDTNRWNGWEPNTSCMKCGGEVNKTFYCNNDLGGPLLYNGKQIGITSYIFYPQGGICGTYLGIYSPVAYFRQWIKDTTDL